MSDRPDNQSRGFPFAAAFMGLLVVYLGPFVAILVDEWVLKNHWFVQHAPDWLMYVFTIVYAPLITFVRYWL